MAASKKTLYIIHGWTYTTAPWARTIALLEKQGITVEMLNVPGLTTASKKVWTIEEYVKWADRSIPSGAIALGHSNGGRILLNLCAEKPTKLQQLILLDAAGVYEPSRKRDFVRKLSKLFGFLKHIPGLTRVWHKLTGTTDYARAPENMKQTLSNMLESDKKLNISQVTTPTSIIWGEADTVTPPRQGEKMHSEIANSTLDMHPNWTHAPYLSHPEELAKAIIYALEHPPQNIPQEEISDAAAGSAALALKRAPKHILKAKDSSNPVAPDVATELVLRKDDSKLTKGMKITAAESAAIKYEPKTVPKLAKTTDAAKASASANLRKAHSAKVIDTDAAAGSASATIRKTVRSSSKTADATTKSAALSLKRATQSPVGQGVIAELDQKSDAKVDFVPLEVSNTTASDQAKNPSSLPQAKDLLAGAITSASVPSAKRPGIFKKVAGKKYTKTTETKKPKSTQQKTKHRITKKKQETKK